MKKILFGHTNCLIGKDVEVIETLTPDKTYFIIYYNCPQISDTILDGVTDRETTKNL